MRTQLPARIRPPRQTVFLLRTQSEIEQALFQSGLCRHLLQFADIGLEKRHTQLAARGKAVGTGALPYAIDRRERKDDAVDAKRSKGTDKYQS